MDRSDDRQFKYWEKLSEKIQSPVKTKNGKPDTSDLEIAFLKQYVKPSDTVIDLGSGSGLIVNKLLDEVKSIVAVEKFEGFTKFIRKSPDMMVINADIKGFKINKEYDLACMFGVGQLFDYDDIKKLYKNIYDMTKKHGKFISRTHCALEEDIYVDGFSKELQTDYFACYRNVDTEIQLIEDVGFKNVQKFDIFPDTLNVWDNSRHFIFVAEK